MTKEQTEFFYNLETSLHKKENRNSREKVSALIADDFTEFGKSGNVYDKQDTLEHLEKEEFDVQVEVSNFSAKELLPGAVLVMYVAVMLDKENTGAKVKTNRSSIWVSRDGRWQMVFHQGTKKENLASRQDM